MAKENKKVKPNDVEKSPIILFFDDDYLETFNGVHDGPMVITTNVHNYTIKRILVD